jgi:hypothetical protein
VLVRQVAGAKNLTAGVQAFLFRGDRDYKLVVWNVDETPRALPLRDAFRNAMVNDALGRPIPSTVVDSKPVVTFGSAPIYVSRVLPDRSMEAVLERLD